MAPLPLSPHTLVEHDTDWTPVTPAVSLSSAPHLWHSSLYPLFGETLHEVSALFVTETVDAHHSGIWEHRDILCLHSPASNVTGFCEPGVSSELPGHLRVTGRRPFDSMRS